ncbi:MAG: hypothetical protein RLZZ244_333 [Verrucomicrobiota bacterium]
MKFTVIFPSHESEDLSFGVVFVPCICWIQGNRILLNPHPDRPHYRKGELPLFLDRTNTRPLLDPDRKNVVVVAHPVGHGTEKDLQLLQEDLWEAGFDTNLVRL